MPRYEKVIADQACRIEELATELGRLREENARCQVFLKIARERCAALVEALESKRGR